MLLSSFRVTAFRNFLDSGAVAVAGDVTCLVGKNESGKTAALRALYLLNPVFEDERLDKQAQYPRWRMTADKRSRDLGTVVPIEATFTLEAADIEAVAARFGHGVLEGDATFTVSRSYDNQLSSALNAGINEQEAVTGFLAKHNVPASTRGALGAPAGPQGLRSGLEAALAAAARLDEPAAAQEVADWTKIQKALEAEVGEADSFVDAVQEFLLGRMPKFFYFGEYQFLPGVINLSELGAAEEKPGTTPLQTVRALLQLANTDVAAITEEDWTSRKAELEAVSNDLTAQVQEYWKQNSELEVLLDIDKVNETLANGQWAVARTLMVSVKDRRHGFSNSFDDRSTGFRWFFSFLAAFSEFEHAGESVIVLLDEPGVTLHGHAQKDFLRFINERLAPAVQVLYTTHSPFMVEPGKLDNIRIVEDRGPEKGAFITQDVLGVGADSSFPLQGALGYDIAQHLFIGDMNCILEGTSDFTYLQAMSAHLKSLGRSFLDERWRLLPVGGVGKVPTFVALMGRDLQVTVVVDETRGEMQKLRNMVGEGLLSQKRLITIADITGTKQADIEDLFDVEDYLSLFNGAFGMSLGAEDLVPGERIVDRISRTRGETFLDHGLPADYFLRNRLDLLPSFGAGTLNRFEQLIDKINATKPAS